MAEDKRTNNPVRLKLEGNQICYGPEWLHLDKELNCLEAVTAVADVRDIVVTSTYKKQVIVFEVQIFMEVRVQN